MIDKKIEGKEFLIEWYVPENIKSHYATNMVVQYTGEEFVISFFEVKPPIILGSPDEIKSLREKIESVKAECLSRIIVSPKRMKTFIKVTALFQPIIFRLLRIIECMLIYHRVTSLASHGAQG